MIPSTIFGAFMIIRSAHFIRNDLSLVVVELQEELEEHRRQEADPEQIPVLQVSNVDFSYGHVQILFGVNFEVQRGEVLALLGTNGAGKSTRAERRRRSGDRRRVASCGSTVATSPTPRRSSAPGSASTCCRAARASSAR